MPIPEKTQFTDPSVTELQFRQALNQLIDFLKSLENQALMFSTTEELLAFMPESAVFAKALDTGKVWYWGKLDPAEPSNTWHETDTSDLDQATAYIKNAVSKIQIQLNDLQLYPNLENPEYAYAISDGKGNSPFAITIKGVNLLPLLRSSQIEINDNLMLDIENPEWAWSVSDLYGNIALGVRLDGSIYPPISAVELGTPNIKPQKTDWIHGNTYGQSLSRGSGSYPVVSIEQPYNNLTFLSGVLPRLSDPHDYTDTKPLVEQRWSASSAEGESPTSGMLNKITELASADNEDLVFFGASSGQGGTALENLSKGTTRYNEQLAMYQSAYDLAQSRGLSYSVGIQGFVQGESNYNRGNSRQEYKQLEVKLKRDFDADIQLITKQDFVPIMVTYQTASHHVATPRRDHVNIALAQWDAHRENEDIVMACSMYAIEYLADNLHLTADSSLQLGKYLGKAAFKTRQYALGLEEKPFRPLEPDSVLWHGKVIDITFNVPEGVLTQDTALVTAAPNLGFDIWVNDVLQESAISSVAIIDKNRARIVLNQTFENAVLSYARGRSSDPATSGPITGPRGNLRDEAGGTDNYLDSKGVRRYMHNWCVIFQYSQTTGFN
ncbi:hypothetical protein MMP65_06050 [Acinetobacter sp. ANC 3926]|uniref:sialate O-acetylesterase n=1 Tax=Acinetobacter genomosp. 15BJ TaxID=106651 RepID=UPI001F4AA865|nr:sialate O-acetylesterase [Acinetobacter genomosp. 15BJ]MCH7291023.1 hypothetical protein [Acinetobacter genomosp. 15BJ]